MTPIKARLEIGNEFTTGPNELKLENQKIPSGSITKTYDVTISSGTAGPDRDMTITVGGSIAVQVDGIKKADTYIEDVFDFR